MKNTPHRFVSPLALIALLSLSATSSATAAVVFSETFDYSAWSLGEAPMHAVWSQTPTTGGPSIVTSNPASPLLETAYMQTSNRVVYTSLGQTLVNDFSLTVNALHSDYSRSLWVGLFNADATQGYGIRWDASSSGTADGNGSLRVVKFAVSSSAELVHNGVFNATDSAIGDYLAGTIGRPGKPASVLGADATFVTVNLAWDNATDTLTLSLGDTVVGTYTDAAFSEFSNLYIGVNGSNAMVGDVTVSSIPEPAQAALLAAFPVVAAAALRRNRRAP